MARIRTIKPGFFASEDVSVLPFRARLTWVGLWTQCDDHGRTKDNVKLIKAAVWPLDDVSLREVEEDLQVLAAGGRIVRYRVGSTLLLAVVNWHAHQSINRPGRPRFPGPSTPLGSDDPEHPNHCGECSVPGPGELTEPSGGLTEDSLNTHGALTPGKEGKGKEGNVGGEPREDVERVCKYLAEWIVRNGSKPPTITEKWRTEARLLIDKDGRSLEEIRKVTAWSQKNAFWKPNILSMPKLREKFDQLRLAMEAEAHGANGNSAPASNAPKSIPPAERCEKHPNFRRDRCGPCRSESGAQPADTTGRST